MPASRRRDRWYAPSPPRGRSRGHDARRARPFTARGFADGAGVVAVPKSSAITATCLGIDDVLLGGNSRSGAAGARCAALAMLVSCMSMTRGLRATEVAAVIAAAGFAAAIAATPPRRVWLNTGARPNAGSDRVRAEPDGRDAGRFDWILVGGGGEPDENGAYEVADLMALRLPPRWLRDAARAVGADALLDHPSGWNFAETGRTAIVGSVLWREYEMHEPQSDRPWPRR